MKKYFVLGVLLTVLSGCGMPVIKKSWEGMGKGDIVKILHDTRSLSCTSNCIKKWESDVRQFVQQYCSKHDLNRDLKSCLSKIGMSCENNICRYKGFNSTVIGGFMMLEKRRKATELIKLSVDTDKGMDSLILEKEDILEMVKPTLWGY